jgi:hypothetical protein
MSDLKRWAKMKLPIPILVLSVFILLGCSRENKETAVLTFNSSDTPYETITIRIQHAAETDSPLMFPRGQPIGGTKKRINPRIRYRNGDEFVEVIIYSNDEEIRKEFALEDGSGVFELPFGISMRVRK